MPINDPFASFAGSLTAPASSGFDITPADGTDLPVLTRAVMIGSAGDLAVTFADGSEVVLPSLAPGVVYALRLARVRATGTTATDIKGLF